MFASGSPFDPVTYEGRTFEPGQGNNAYVYPGIALGVIVAGIHHIKEDLFLAAAQCVADSVTDEDIERGSLYPPLGCIREVSVQIATDILEYAYREGGLIENQGYKNVFDIFFVVSRYSFSVSGTRE